MTYSISNQRFGSLVALFSLGKNDSGKEIWQCLCDCGETRQVEKNNLVGGYSTSCGKFSKHRDSLIGNKYGKLTVVSLHGITDHRTSIWVCICECGNTTNVRRSSLLSGDIKSCGCTKRRVQIGDVFGKWHVLEYSCSVPSSNRGTIVYWWCSCECGFIREIRANALNYGDTTACRSCSKTKHGLSRTAEYIRQKLKGQEINLSIIDVDWSESMQHLLKSMQKICVVCGKRGKLEVDHVKPASKGYGLRPGNAVMLCRQCNTKKSDKLPEDLPADWRDKILSAAEEFKAAWESGFRA